MDAQEKEWYRDWFNSPYYHLLYQDRDEQEAASFIDLLIDHLQPKVGAYMLDVACGKGRHSFQLAKKGYLVTGIDISPKSIREAQTLANNELEFFVHDMRLPFRINYYDYAFNFFTSFGYFDTQREHLNAIHNISLSIKNEGMFIMDYLNPQYILQNLESHSEVRRGDIVFSIDRFAEKGFFFKKIMILDPLRKEPLRFVEKVAQFSLENFKEMFSANNLSVIEVFGDYHLDSYRSASSPRMIMILKKR